MMLRSKKMNRCHMIRRLMSMICVMVFIISSVPVIASAGDNKPKPIKVGYYENEVFQEGAKDGAIKKGYAYEYYRKMSEYTGWKYEYVYGEYSDLYQMLLDGEIDLLAGLAWKEDRVDLLSYPELPMGNETYNLVKHASADTITADPKTLNKKVIGVLDSAMVEALNKYLKNNRITATVKTYNDYKALFTAFDKGELDLIAAEGDGAYGRDNAEVLIPFATSDYYLCVNKARSDLLSELNEAQATLAVEEPNWLHSLSTKFYPVSISARAFSTAEKEWLNTHSSLKVGYLNHYLPYSDTDKDGKVTGIIKDIVPELLSDLGLSHLTVTYHGYESYDEMISGMSSEEIDVAFPVGGGSYFSEENGIYQSTPIISTSSNLVFKGAYSENTTKTIAVNESNRIQYYYTVTYFPDAEISLYPSIEDCLDAVLSGKANCTMLNGLRTSDLLKRSKYKGLELHQLAQSDDHCFGVEIGNEGLLKLLNRGINVIGGDYAQNASFRYTENLNSYSLMDVLRDHMILFVSIILVIVAIIIFLFVRDRIRTKKQVIEKESARLILEEKNAQLKASQKELAQTNEIISDAGYGTWYIILEDGEKPRMHGNNKMMQLLGLEGQDLSHEEIFDAWYSRIIHEEIPLLQKNLDAMLKGDFTEVTYRWDHPTKGVLYIRCGGSSKENEPHRQVIQGYHSDVTDLVREEQAQKEALQNALATAEHANHAKTAFLNNMSHDIRTPMNAIAGFTALAATHIDNKEQVRDYLGKIAVSSQHLLSLINDVLDMSRIESGKMMLEETEVHLPELIHDLQTIVQANISAKQLALIVNIKDVVHEDVVTDKLRLNQVLLNIMSNAIKFTPSGGTITFRVIEKPSSAKDMTNFEFRIKDTGIGMTKEFQKTIFEAFTREKTSTVSGIQGTGLGMAITKNILDMMGGTITVESEEGKGSEFIVDISCRVNTQQVNAEPIPELKGLRALVADNDTETCLSVCAMLRKIGMRPDWTNSGEEAVARAKDALDNKDGFKAYIIDWLLPDLNGVETVRRIHELSGDDASTVILTAYDWADIENEARDAGVTAFCSKPLFTSELRSVMMKPFANEDEAPAEKITVDFTGKRVLLAEDNEMNQIIAEAVLSEVGLAVDIAGNGEEAVEKMKAAPAGYYDIILMDIQMPKMDGYTAAKLIRDLDDPDKANVPIVAVTANAFEEDRKIALKAGMNGHLAKPYDIPKMMETLKELLG